MTNAVTQFIRMGVAAAVAFLLSFAVAHGFPHVDPATKDAIIAALVGVIMPVYYNVVKELEKHWPWLGHLLLVRERQPQKPPAPPANIRRRPAV